MQLDTRVFANVAGAVYIGVGLLGFALTGLSGFASPDGELLIIFEVNPLHNLVHVLIGIALVAGAGAGAHVARQITLLVAALYAAVGVAGFVLPGDPSADVLALNTADNVLHLATAALALLASSRSRVATASGSTGPEN